MRIISGWLGGRQFEAPRGHKTHPMSEKARGALFGVLGDIKNLTVLDPFAGSGALSYEAISRGAKSALAIEMDKSAVKMIEENLEKLAIQDRVTLLPAHCVRWSDRYREQQFDLVLCDPPYDRILIRDIQKLSRHVATGGIMVLSWPRHLKTELLDGLTLLKVNPMGDAQLVFYRKDI